MKQEKKELEISREMYPAVRFISGVLALALMIFTGYGAITFCLGLFAEGEHIVRLPGQESPLVTLSDLPQAPTPIHVDPDQVVEIARADISVAGDVMPHLPIVRSGRTGNGYNFDDVFTYLESYISGADYAVANLETTFSGTDGKDYTGYPNFNSPDAIAASAKNTGFDMLLTGNNHIYDYGTPGLKRTLSVVESFGLESLGAVADKENSRHVIHTLGGVKVGMVSYTFADIDNNGNVTVNGHKTDSAAAGLISAFDYKKLSQFYTEAESEIAAMKANGADAIVMYIHWGDEYSTMISDSQQSIAQKLCDLGVDVIVGSHPHVVQPIDLLVSTVDPNHTTICAYSTGTLLSNLRADTIDMPTSHCEDGLLFSFTLSKYNDGTTRVSAVKLLPTWVLVVGSGDDRDFRILPLDMNTSDWGRVFDLSAEQQVNARDSYNRTIALVTQGLNKITSHLNEQNAGIDPSMGLG